MAVKKTAPNPLKSVMGPLWNLFDDKQVWEILIDAYDDVYYVKNSEIVPANKVFKKEQDLNSFVERLLKFSKKKIAKDELSHFFQLDPHSRVNIVLPPLTIKGPSVIITKLPKQKVTFDNLIEWKALDEEGKNILESILKSDTGFLVAGNVGSGKTTLLNTLVNAIPQPRRVVTLERIPDLVLDRPMVCRLQSQTHKASEMIELISTAERLRGDYVVLSDLVGPELGAFMEMIRNNCTGIALTSGENVLDVIKRIETKAVLSSEGLTLEEVRYVIAQSFKHLIFQERRPDGRRVISSISELQYTGGELKIVPIYKR